MLSEGFRALAGGTKKKKKRTLRRGCALLARKGTSPPEEKTGFDSTLFRRRLFLFRQEKRARFVIKEERRIFSSLVEGKDINHLSKICSIGCKGGREILTVPPSFQK